MSRWWVHALALVVVLAGLAATGDLEASWTSDDGAYAVQTELVREDGTWEYPNRHPEADPTAAATPIAHSSITTDGRTFPYAKQPAWIAVLVASTRAFGDVVGLHVPALAGILLSALVAWGLARELVPGAEPWAFWAVALGPLLLQGTTLWAHSVAAAAGGLLGLWVARSAAGRVRWVDHALAGGAALVLGLLRNEGVLAVAAAAGVVGVLALAAGGPVPSRVRAAVPAGLVALAGAAAALANRAWIASLVDGTVRPSADAPPGVGLVEGRFTGFLRTFVDGAGTRTAGTALGLAAVAAAVGAGWALRRGERAPALVLGVAAVALVGVRTATVGEDDLAGLLVAGPLLAAGAGALSWRAASPAVRACAALVALDWLATAAVQYPEGGGREWGGRYALTVAVPATVVALAALRAAWAAAPPAASRAAVAALAALVLVPTVGGLVVTRAVATDARAQGDRLAALEGEPVIVTARFVPRLGWRHLPEADWLIGRPGEVDGLLARLRPTAEGPVVVVGPGATDARAAGYRRTVRGPQEVVFTPVP